MPQRQWCSCDGNILCVCCRSCCRHISGSPVRHNWCCPVDFGIGAVLADMARFSALVAGLSSCVERTAIGSSAVARDMALQSVRRLDINDGW